MAFIPLLKKWCFTLLPLLSFLGADLIDERKSEIFARFLAKPWPDPNHTDADPQVVGRLAVIFASFHNRTNLIQAEEYLQSLERAGFIPEKKVYEYPGYFAMPLFTRLCADPRLAGQMSTRARETTHAMLWRFLKSRSELEAGGSSPAKIWSLHATENHNAIVRSSFLLAAKVLLDSPAYGNLRLDDAHTLREHYGAWLVYWLEYFRQRAREGISVELASPPYEKYTLACYYNLRDWGGSPALRQIADDFLNLYWADVAQDFLTKTGTRGGAGQRM